MDILSSPLDQEFLTYLKFQNEDLWIFQLLHACIWHCGASEEDALSTLLRPTWPNHWACKDFFGTNWNMWIISFHWYLIIRIMVWSWRSVEIRCFWQISSLSLVHTSRPKPMKRARSYSSVYWKRNNENSVSKVLEEYSKYFLLRFPFACTMHDLGSGHSLTMA